MKNLAVLFFVLICFIANAQDKKDVKNDKGPKIQFVKDVYDFGNIYVGSGHDAIAEFKFVNTGNEPLVLTNVKTSCGCTAPYWQKDPVLPGDTGKISLKYNNVQSPNTINKSATVQSNATNNPTIVIRITGTVLAKPEIMWPEKNIDKTASPFAQ